MYYLITKNGVVSGGSIAVINRKLGIKISDDEFNVVGPDHIVKVDDVDLDFLRDKRRMENIAFSGFFRKDKTPQSLMCMLMILQVLFFFILNSKLGG